MRNFAPVFLALVLLTITGCSEVQQSPESTFKPNIHLSDAKTKDLLISRLEEEKIPHHIEFLDQDKNEYVVWRKEDDPRVKSIIREITKSDCNDSDQKSITMINDEQNNHLVSLLEQEGIAYVIVPNTLKNDTDFAIEYNIADDEKVRKLVISTLREKPFYKKGT